jgi:hypothetical protein
MKTYLIPISTIKEYSVIDENVDEKIIKTSILDAQEQMLEPILGTSLYDKIITDTENATLTEAYQELIIKKVWPFLIHATVYKVCLNLIYRITNSSVVKDSNAVSTAISLQELNVMRQEREAGIKYTQEKLILYLQNNMTTYPEYMNYNVEGLQASGVTQPRNFFANEDEYTDELKQMYKFPL